MNHTANLDMAAMSYCHIKENQNTSHLFSKNRKETPLSYAQSPLLPGHFLSLPYHRSNIVPRQFLESQFLVLTQDYQKIETED